MSSRSWWYQSKRLCLLGILSPVSQDLSVHCRVVIANRTHSPTSFVSLLSLSSSSSPTSPPSFFSSSSSCSSSSRTVQKSRLPSINVSPNLLNLRLIPPLHLPNCCVLAASFRLSSYFAASPSSSSSSSSFLRLSKCTMLVVDSLLLLSCLLLPSFSSFFLRTV